MIESYQPVACAMHDVFEIAVMRRKKLFLKWIDDNGKIHKCEVLPEDVVVRDGAEYLQAVSLEDQQKLCIRLDKITLLDK